MPKPFPPEFRRDVVSVARSSDASMAQIARDFGISESCLSRWLKIANREDGLGDRPGGRRSTGDATTNVTPAETASAEERLRALERRNRQLEQENEVLRRATAYFARDVLPK